MDPKATEHHNSASKLASDALDHVEASRDIGQSLAAVVETGAALVQIGLAMHVTLNGIREAVINISRNG